MIMAYSPLLLFCLVFATLDLSRAAYVNTTISSAVNRLGGSLTITVDFFPDTYFGGLDTLKCGYELGGAAFVTFTEYSTRRNQLEAVTSGFPASYNGRFTIPSAKVMQVSNLKFEDEGTKYHCEMKYTNVTKIILISNSVSITQVYDLPQFNSINTVSNTTDVVEGKSHSLYCNVSSRPASSVTWSHDSTIIATQSNFTIISGYHTFSIGTLTINSVDLSMDKKTVTCIGTPVYGSPITRNTTLNVQYSPKDTTIIVSPANPIEKQYITVNCSAVGNPAVTNYMLYIGDTLLGSSTNGTFLIYASECKKFSGDYKCSATNAIGNSPNKTQNIVVSAPVKITQMSPVTKNETNDVTITCPVSGCPAPSVKWNKKGSNTVLANTADLKLSNVTLNEAGVYVCIASNNVTNASAEVSLTVNYKPISTTIITDSLTPVENSPVKINCSATAEPKAMYKFYQVTNSSSDTELTNNVDQKSGVLEIEKIVAQADSYNLTYKCVPFNLLGDGPSKSINLDVQVAPEVKAVLTPNSVDIGGNTTLQCTVERANPAATLTASDPSGNLTLINGAAEITSVTREQNGTYTCTAANTVGIATDVAELTVNHPPMNTSLSTSNAKPINGGSITLTCSSVASPPARYNFYRIVNSTAVEIASNSSSTYTVSNIDYAALGGGGYSVTYRCMPFNRLGNGTTKDVKIDIQVPPQLEVSANVTVTEGGNASFTCTVKAANPSASVSWWSENANSNFSSSNSLQLTSVTRHQSGRYYCKAENGVGSPVMKYVSLTVNHSPSNVSLTTTSPTTIKNGSTVTMTCKAEAVPAAQYHFYEVIAGQSKMVSSANSGSTGVLRIAVGSYDTSSYKTSYKCKAMNSVGNGTEQSLTFDVQVDPQSLMVSPSTATYTVTEGSPITVNCSAVGNPTPTITWTSSVGTDSFSGSMLSFSSVRRTDAKVYTCTARNSVGSKTKTILVVVQYGPETSNTSNTTHIKCEGDAVTIYCEATGVPVPDVKIVYKNQVLKSATSKVDHTLPSLAANQFGTYICSANNTIGIENVSTNVNKSDTPGEVRGLSLKVVDGGFDVSWTVPRCKGKSGIKEYRISYKKAGASSWKESDLTNQLTFKVINLEDGADYTIGVAVIGNNNRVGTYSELTRTATNLKGPDSGKSEGDDAPIIAGAVGGSIAFLLIVALIIVFFMRKKRSSQVDPKGALEFQLEQLDDSKVLVNWTSPTKGVDSPLLKRFDILWKTPGSSEAVKSVKYGARDYSEVIDGLDSGCRYEFRIVAVAKNGNTGRCSVSKMLKTDTGVEYGNGGLPASYGNTATKDKNNDNIDMKDMNDGTKHLASPKGDLYAVVSNKGKKDNPAYNGGVDNDNFVTESDGAYDPVKVESPKSSPEPAKKAEGNYAELSSFRAGDEPEKSKPNADKTEYASLQDLGPLKPAEDTPEGSGEPEGTRVVVTPENDTSPDSTKPTSSPEADTTGSRVNLI